MKLSFSAPKKSSKQPSSKPASRSLGFGAADDGREAAESITFLTQFDPSESKGRIGVNGDGTLPQTAHVIPPKANEWRPVKKMKNLDLPMQLDPAASGLEKFETQTKSLGEETDGSGVSYGLTVRKNNAENAMPADEEIEPDEPRKRTLSDAQKFKEDVERLGDDPGFDDMPVEGFGTALLAGYGWTEGRGIGRNAKEDVKVRQYERGAGKHGLGFKDDQDMPTRKVKRSESNDRGQDKPREVRIVGGSEDSLVGLKGEVLGVVGGGDWVVLRLSKSREEVRVSVKDVAELGSKEEDECLKKLKDLRIRNLSNGNGKSRREEVKRTSRDGEARRNGEAGRSDTAKVGWLVSHIRVRVISKDLKGGRLYRRKGEVVDVVGPTSCDILMDESRELIQGVDQKALETALPKRGGPVYVLSGRHRGIHGNLVDRDLDRETGIVCDADSHELFNVSLDQVAEYIGDPSLVGY